MRYGMYETQTHSLRPVRAASRATATAIESLPVGLKDSRPISAVYAAASLTAHTRLRHERPAFGIDSVQTSAGPGAVVEEIVDFTPFCDLLRFRKDGAEVGPPV